MIQRRLDGAASRLEIKASQQSAWQAYAAAVQALGETDAMSRRSRRRTPMRRRSRASAPNALRLSPAS